METNRLHTHTHTCNFSDLLTQAPEDYGHYLDDPKLLHWFGINPTVVVNAQQVFVSMGVQDHPKFTPIPIGLPNRYWNTGLTAFVRRTMFQVTFAMFLHLHKQLTLDLYENTTSMLMSWRPNKVAPGFRDTHAARSRLLEMLHGRCGENKIMDFPKYLKALTQTSFVLNPRGNGLDTHRTWFVSYAIVHYSVCREALYFGCVPVNNDDSKPLRELLDLYPIFWVGDWNEFKCGNDTELNKADQLLDMYKPTSDQALWMPFWFETILAVARTGKKKQLIRTESFDMILKQST